MGDRGQKRFRVVAIFAGVLVVGSLVATIGSFDRSQHIRQKRHDRMAQVDHYMKAR